MKFLAQAVGTINPPAGAVSIPAGQSETSFVAGIIRGGIQFILIIGFIVSFIWIIFAGFRFVFSGGDEKSISGAWSQIYWGLLGMLIVVGAFAIIVLVETFFNVKIVSSGLKLPKNALQPSFVLIKMRPPLKYLSATNSASHTTSASFSESA